MVLLWRKEFWMIMQLLIWRVIFTNKIHIPKKIIPKGTFNIQWSDTIDYDNILASYIENHKGKLIYVPEGSDVKQLAGEIKCTKVKDQISNDGFDRFESLHTKSGGLSRVGQLMNAIDWFKDVHISNYHQEFNVKQTEKKLTNDVGDIDEIRQGSVLYISHVTVRDDFNGFGLGLFLVDQADHLLNDPMSLCLLIPFPLQYENAEVAKEDSEFAVAKEKVTNHWMRYLY
jgi:predicted GNAT family acetyltransferase